MSVPTAAYVAIGILLVLVAIPVGLSLGPLVLGAGLAVIGLRRLHRAVGAVAAVGGLAAVGPAAGPDPLAAA